MTYCVVVDTLLVVLGPDLVLIDVLDTELDSTGVRDTKLDLDLTGVREGFRC